MPLSRLAALLSDRILVAGNSREKALLIWLHRTGKLLSPDGSDHTACIWSGSTQMAIVSNGWRSSTTLYTFRKSSMWRTRRSLDRSASVMVKKYTPPSILARRYCGMIVGLHHVQALHGG